LTLIRSLLTLIRPLLTVRQLAAPGVVNVGAFINAFME
jgi:hypothetical protein